MVPVQRAVDAAMIQVLIEDPAVLALLPACYTNKLLNVASQGARRKVNQAKQAFTDAVAERETHRWTPSKDVAWTCSRCSAKSTLRKPPTSCCSGGQVVRLGCTARGKPVVGPALVLYEFCLPRCDVDAPLKAVQDAVARLVLQDGDDRAVVVSAQSLSRPVRTTKRRVGVGPFVRVMAYPLCEIADFLRALAAEVLSK